MTRQRPAVFANDPTTSDSGLLASGEFDVDSTVEPLLREALAALDGRAPLLAGMARYHLGYADAGLQSLPSGAADRGKRVRPAIALLVAGAEGGSPDAAAPVAAALELLHNFTLVHDDIQDESRTRRHRSTAWTIWGVGQAINAGDALFAAAHLPFYGLPSRGVPPDMALRLLEEFDRMAIAIVAGQTLDLTFETRADVTPAEYLSMIAGKTAAIVRYAAWAGALLGGANEASARRWGEFGLALGLGFQIRDDLLGIWGAPDETGKPPADDVRRRKKSLPILLLRQRLDATGREELDRLYAVQEVDDVAVSRIVAMLAQANIRQEVEIEIARYHDQASETLRGDAQAIANTYRDLLQDLVERLATRSR